VVSATRGCHSLGMAEGWLTNLERNRDFYEIKVALGRNVVFPFVYSCRGEQVLPALEDQTPEQQSSLCAVPGEKIAGKQEGRGGEKLLMYILVSGCCRHGRNKSNLVVLSTIFELRRFN
jgi:hypothetical protein